MSEAIFSMAWMLHDSSYKRILNSLLFKTRLSTLFIRKSWEIYRISTMRSKKLVKPYFYCHFNSLFILVVWRHLSTVTWLEYILSWSVSLLHSSILWTDISNSRTKPAWIDFWYLKRMLARRCICLLLRRVDKLTQIGSNLYFF